MFFDFPFHLKQHRQEDRDDGNYDAKIIVITSVLSVSDKLKSAQGQPAAGDIYYAELGKYLALTDPHALDRPTTLFRRSFLAVLVS